MKELRHGWIGAVRPSNFLSPAWRNSFTRSEELLAVPVAMRVFGCYSPLMVRVAQTAAAWWRPV